MTGKAGPTPDPGAYDTADNGFVHEGSEVLSVPRVTRWFLDRSR